MAFDFDMECWNLRQAYLLDVGLTQILANHETLPLVLPYKNPCRLLIHDNFFGSLGLRLLVWNELGRSQPFQPMRDLSMLQSLTFNLVCE